MKRRRFLILCFLTEPILSAGRMIMWNRGWVSRCLDCGALRLIQPLYDVRNTGDVLIEIAKGLGGSVGKSFPWKDFQEALKEAIKGIFASKRGSIQAKDFDEFWKALIERGGWWDPPYSFGEWRKKFNTPSGKFEFYSLAMERGLKEVSKRSIKGLDQILQELKIEARGDKVFLPHFEKPRWVGDDKELSLPSHPL